MAGASALGWGAEALAPTLEGRLESALRLDRELGAQGLSHPLVGRVELGALGPDSDRATELLTRVTRELKGGLERACPGWRKQRILVLLGTSAGPMQSMEQALALRGQGQPIGLELGSRANYFSPLRPVAEVLEVSKGSVGQVLAACAASSMAIGLGCRALEAGHADIVIAGGYDAVTPLVARGFEAIGALSRSRPRPFHPERDGLALGEGAGLLALVPSHAGPSLGRVLGFGSACDAVHPTAPDPEGRGLIRAARAALDDAGLEPAAIDLLSPHATATVQNDAAEARALSALFGTRRIPTVPLKGIVGHTLGASSALEAIATLWALSSGIVPGAPAGDFDGHRLIESSSNGRRLELRHGLKLSAAFGGATAALVLGRSDAAGASRACGRRPVRLSAVTRQVDQAAPEAVLGLVPQAELLVARADSVSELALAALARLLESLPGKLDPDAAVVLGTAGATLETLERFDHRRRAGRPLEPRCFPPTSPNLAAALCSIAFRLHGPCFAVGSGPGAAREALVAAHDLISAGDAPSAVVIAVEDAGPVSRDLYRAAGRPSPERGASAALLQAGGRGELLSRESLLGAEVGPDPDLELLLKRGSG